MTKDEQQRVDEEQLIRQNEVITALIKALRECEVEIDMAIEEMFPRDVNAALDTINAEQRAHNAARIALDAYDAGRNK